MDKNDDLNFPVVEKTSLIDAKKYEGKRIAIAKVDVRDEINYYPDGINYDPKSTDVVKRVYFISEPLRELDAKLEFTEKIVMKAEDDGTQSPITVHARFNLQKEKDKWVISKHPKAKLWQAMRKLGVSNLKDAVGKITTLDSVPSKDENDNRVFLRLNL